MPPGTASLPAAAPGFARKAVLALAFAAENNKIARAADRIFSEL
jgi:hypothetical protein